MKINTIRNVHIMQNCDVIIKDEDWLFEQPDKKKENVGMFNYWSEKKRSNVSDNAVMYKLVLDYDNGARRKDVEKQFETYSYMIYNSTGNQSSKGIEKFRVILELKEPVLASDLKYWRSIPEFVKFFDGVDRSTFHVIRFFYRASKFDKDGEPVVITMHNGVPFDFYGLFPHHEVFQPFEDLKMQLKMQRLERAPKRSEASYEERLSKFINKVGACRSSLDGHSKDCVLR